MVELEWHNLWVEYFAGIFIVLGFLLAILLHNPLFSYITIILTGFLGGRLYYIKRYKEPIFPFFLITIGFLGGYLIGSFWISRFVALLLFLLSFIISYKLHVKKIIGIFKSPNFLK